jgi:hypothetical protein
MLEHFYITIRIHKNHIVDLKFLKMEASNTLATTGIQVSTIVDVFRDQGDRW